MQAADQSIRFPGGRIGFLLIHGLGGTPIEMRYVAQGLARAGHTAHVPQLAGHCGTAEELNTTCWEDWYATVEEEHQRMAEHCHTIVVWPVDGSRVGRPPRGALPARGVRHGTLRADTVAGWLGHPLVQQLFQA